jgi:hypothetical protein
LHVGPLLGIVNTVSDVPERWSQARVYPDMWVDPDEDPRGSNENSPDGELATLQDYMRHYRLTLQMKCEGLDAEKLARRSVPPSTMSLLGLLRHLAEGERAWRNWIRPDEQAATDALLAEYPDLGTRVGQDGIAVRELWVHRIEEYARHCGHADLLRECIDGRVGQ